MSASLPLLRSSTPDEVARLFADTDEPAYRGEQLRDWVFGRGALSWAEMTNLPRSLRDDLASRWCLTGLETSELQEAQDGTRKFLFRLRDGHTIESVIIPMAEHATFCLSTQVGCAMACSFCATARGGLARDLEAGEIVEQYLHLRRELAARPYAAHGDRAPNVVFMGMGEPLDNWPAVRTSLAIMADPRGLDVSRRRLQISTSGPREGLEQLLTDQPGVGLTLSLGGVDDESRRKLMPVPGRTPVATVIDLAARYARVSGRRVTVAWVLIADRTDGPEQAAALGRLLANGPFKVNLIPWNPLEEADTGRPSRERTLAFQADLRTAGVDAFVRDSGGRDIAAACGQLRRRRSA